MESFFNAIRVLFHLSLFAVVSSTSHSDTDNVKSGTSGHLRLAKHQALLRGVKAVAQATANNIVNTAMENVQNRPMGANGVNVAHEKPPVIHGIEEAASDDSPLNLRFILHDGNDWETETDHASIFSEDGEVEEHEDPLNTAFLMEDPEDDEYESDFEEADNDETPVVHYGIPAKEVPPPSGKVNWGSPIVSPRGPTEMNSYLDGLLDDDSLTSGEASDDENEEDEEDWIARLQKLLPPSRFNFDPNHSVISKAEDHFITGQFDHLFNEQ